MNSQSGVTYEGNLPLSWEPLTGVAPAEAADWMHSDAVLLHALSTMEAAVSDPEGELAGARGKALERVEAKLDLALDLLAKLLFKSSPRPFSADVVLSASSLQWRTPHPPAAGEQVLIKLYLKPSLPLPITLPARITDVAPGDMDARVQAEFVSLSDEVQDWLERTVFRYHRRAIQARHAGSKS
jgi:hypothetical protein